MLLIMTSLFLSGVAVFGATIMLAWQNFDVRADEGVEFHADALARDI